MSIHVILATLLEIPLVYIERVEDLSQSTDFSTCLMLVLRLALADASAETLTRGNWVSSMFYT